MAFNWRRKNWKRKAPYGSLRWGWNSAYKKGKHWETVTGTSYRTRMGAAIGNREINKWGF